MLKINDEIIGIVEKLTFEGFGIIRYSKSQFVIFVKNVLINEKVKVKITSINKKFAKAELIEILEENENRIKPICPIYNACGSCNFQICNYDYSLKLKTLILKDIFKNVINEDKIFDVIKSPKTLEYRHKIQFPTQRTKNSKRMILGYYKEKSHDLTNIKFCPLQPKIINEIAQYIRDFFPYSCYCEKTNQGLLKNVLFRINQNQDSLLLTFVLNLAKKECSKNDYKGFFNKIIEKFPIIKGCFLNFNPNQTNTILGGKTLKITGEDYIFETLDDKKYKIGATSFFQVNPSAAKNLFDIVKDNVDDNSSILDAYGGVGAIGIYLSDKVSKITLVEENSNAILMAKDNFILNNIENYEIFEGDAREHLLNFEKENKKFDYVILDPPRSGCEAQGLKTLANLAKNIIYVSCNPMTLKRDMQELAKLGFKPKFIQGVDLFPYTYHIECVCKFEK